MASIDIPTNHPRYQSLVLREKLLDALHSGVVTEAGLFAHGRGESLDYFLGESTQSFAYQACQTAAACLLTAERPIISVNGNVAALVPHELVRLSEETGAKLEVNLFYRTQGREAAIEAVLKKAGAKEVLGVAEDASATIKEISHNRRIVSPQGILIADTVIVPLEDGDRTEALVAMGKKVLTIDLNPLSRTAQKAHLTIVDHIVRALPLMIEAVCQLKSLPYSRLKAIEEAWDNAKALAQALEFLANRLLQLASQKSSKP